MADNTWSAEQGRKALQIKWDRGANGDYQDAAYKKKLLDAVQETGSTVLERGDVDRAAEQTHEAVYYAPLLAQAPMEPPSAVARVDEDGSCEVWACVQHPQAARDTVAATLGVDKKKVTVNVTLLGGGFGRKSKPDFVAEAANCAGDLCLQVGVGFDEARNVTAVEA